MKQYFVAILLLAALSSCSREEYVNVEITHPDADPTIAVAGSAHVYLSDEMVEMVEMSQAQGTIITKSSDFNQILQELGVTSMYRLFPHAGEFEPRTRAEGLHKWYVINYNEQNSVTKAQTVLETFPGVEIVEPVQSIKINDFNDLNSELWGLYNTSNPGFDINVKPVWDNFTTGAPNVVVAVVDDGLDLKHQDLQSNVYSTHYNFVDNSNAIIPGDHGTHVAGTISASNNNGIGVASVAGGNGSSRGVSLMSCQIFRGDEGAGGAQAIKWAADHGAVISQNSWGYNFDVDGDGNVTGAELDNARKTTISAADRASVDYFIKYAGCDNDGNQLPNSPMKGGVVIFAAGNDAIDAGAPAEYSEVIAVGSIDSNGTRSYFSNYGNWVDICAPGYKIKSTLPNNSYGLMSGTSMSCPHVSGVAALLVSYFGGPGFTNEMLKEKLLSSANKSIISQAYHIGGLVDAYGAFVYGNDKAPKAIEDAQVSPRGNNIDITLSVPSDEDGIASYGFLVIYDTEKGDVEASTENNLANVNYRTFVPEVSAGEKTTLILSKLDFETEYHLKVIPYSYGRKYGPATDVYTTVTTCNNAPVLNSVPEGPFSLLSSETLNIIVEVIEPDGHNMSVEHIKGSAAESILQQPDGTWKLTIKGSGADMGTYTSTIKAVDEYGLGAELGIVYTIKENSAPVKSGEIGDVLLTRKGQEFDFDMTLFANDPDGEQLKYEVLVSNSKVVYITSKDNKLIGKALSYGTTDVTVVAKDARGEKVTFNFKVTVKDPSDPLSLYPNPVKDFLNVATLDLADTEIVISSSTGKVMFRDVMKVSAQDPARIDMSSYVPGTYSVQVRFGGKEYKKNVVKL